MTQIIGLITPTCVMLAADRLLTWNGGPHDGKVFRDEECKLVALCAFGGIGYTGLARLQSKPTHEWIAVALAEGKSRRVADAARVLPERLSSAVRHVPAHLRGLTLFVAAWDWFGDEPMLRPHFALITNQYDHSGNPLPAHAATVEFQVFSRALQPSEPFALHSVGQPLSKRRSVSLSRSLRRALQHDVEPHRLLKYLVAEVQQTSSEAKRVGDRVLTMCVPLQSVEAWLRSGQHFILASAASSDSATFGYFNPDRRELLQFGPTYVCGESAFTDVKTTNDPDTNTQSSSIKLLYLPKRNTTALSEGAA